MNIPAATRPTPNRGIVWKYGTPLFNFILFSSFSFLSLSFVREKLEWNLVLKPATSAKLEAMQRELAVAAGQRNGNGNRK